MPDETIKLTPAMRVMLDEMAAISRKMDELDPEGHEGDRVKFFELNDQLRMWLSAFNAKLEGRN